MHRIDPFASKQRYLRPLSIFPVGRNGGLTDPVKARTDLKIAALLHDNLTLPASSAIQVPALRSLMMQLAPLLEASVITLSMRSSAESFANLAKIKRQGEDHPRLDAAASLFDRICTQVIEFEPGLVNDLFLSIVRERLEHDVRIDLEKGAKQSIDEFLSEGWDGSSFDEIFNAFNSSKYAARFQTHCKFAYAIAGAEHANCDVVLSRRIVDTYAHPTTLGRSDLAIAHDALLEFFSIDSAVIHQLDAHDILELRSTSRFERLVRELHCGIEQAEFSGAEELRADRERQIRAAIHARAEMERARSDQREFLRAVAEDAAMMSGGAMMAALAFVPMNLVKRGVARVSKIARSRSPLLADRLIIERAPLNAYVEDLQALGRRKLAP